MAAAFNAILADDRPINVRPWLYRIARNRSLNHLRRTQAIAVDTMDYQLSEHGATTADKVHEREEFRVLVGDHRVEGRGEDLLQHVLGVLARAQHVPAEGQQPRLVAPHQRLVGGLVAAPGQGDEPLIGLDPKQGRRAAKAVGADVLEGGGFHA